MTDDEFLKLVERGWRDKGMKGDLPLSLLEAIADGAQGFDKQIVRNLAMQSVLLKDDGSVMKWVEIVKQWSLTRIHFGEHKKCSVCTRYPIVEHCILTNEITGTEITVGNRCVLRYLDIIVEGDDEESKAQHIKRLVNAAKRTKRDNDFKLKHPTFWQDLNRHEEVLIAYRPRLLKAISNRMKNHNHLSDGLEHEWIHFLSESKSLTQKLAKETKSKNERYNALRAKQNAIASLRQTELNSVRLRRREMAKTIESEIEVLREYASGDEIDILEQDIQFIQAGGLPSTKGSTVYERLKHRKQVHLNGSDEHDDEQKWLHALDPGRLTKAERLFRYITLAKPAAKVTAGDRSAIRRLKSRY